MNEIFNVKTRAEFLNKKFGTNYKQYMRCTWHGLTNATVWMVQMDGKTNSLGFKNTLTNDTTIVEEYLGNDSIKKEKFADTACGTRLAVRIVKNRQYKQYEILGFFTYDESSDKHKKHTWRKV